MHGQTARERVILALCSQSSLSLCARPKTRRSCYQAIWLKQEHCSAGLPVAGKMPGGVRISRYLSGRLLCAVLHPGPALAGLRCLLCLHQVRTLPDATRRLEVVQVMAWPLQS